MGYLAALSEMLLQSQLPGTIKLLPSLPTPLGQQGHVYGLQARGDALVSMQWRKGLLLAAEIVFNSAHFWHQKLAVHWKYPGFYRTLYTEGSSKIVVTAPNKLVLYEGKYTGSGTVCKIDSFDTVITPANNKGESEDSQFMNDAYATMTMSIQSFACVWLFCGDVDSVKCGSFLRRMQVHNDKF